MLDLLKEKILSRKFAAAIVAVVAASQGTIAWSDALNIVMLWLSVQGVSDIVAQIRKESK